MRQLIWNGQFIPDPEVWAAEAWAGEQARVHLAQLRGLEPAGQRAREQVIAGLLRAWLPLTPGARARPLSARAHALAREVRLEEARVGSRPEPVTVILQGGHQPCKVPGGFGGTLGFLSGMSEASGERDLPGDLPPGVLPGDLRGGDRGGDRDGPIHSGWGAVLTGRRGLRRVTPGAAREGLWVLGRLGAAFGHDLTGPRSGLRGRWRQLARIGARGEGALWPEDLPEADDLSPGVQEALSRGVRLNIPDSLNAAQELLSLLTVEGAPLSLRDLHPLRPPRSPLGHWGERALSSQPHPALGRWETPLIREARVSPGAWARGVAQLPRPARERAYAAAFGARHPSARLPGEGDAELSSVPGLAPLDTPARAALMAALDAWPRLQREAQPWAGA